MIRAAAPPVAVPAAAMLTAAQSKSPQRYSARKWLRHYSPVTVVGSIVNLIGLLIVVGFELR